MTYTCRANNAGRSHLSYQALLDMTAAVVTGAKCTPLDFMLVLTCFSSPVALCLKSDGTGICSHIFNHRYVCTPTELHLNLYDLILNYSMTDRLYGAKDL